MDTKLKLEKYRADLEKEISPFNVWAFIFSSFFFLYIGMSWHFIFFMILPWVLVYLFLQVLEILPALIAGLAISHILAGLVANRGYREFKKKYVERCQGVNPDAPVEYFAISIPHLIVCLVLSCGVYAVYWGYKNWDRYQRATHDDVNPVARGYFFHFTAPFLFAKMVRCLKLSKSYMALGVLYLLSDIIARFIAFYANHDQSHLLAIPEEYIGLLFWGALVFFVLELISLVLMQRAVNRYTVSELKKTPEKSILWIEVIWVLVGLLIFVLS